MIFMSSLRQKLAVQKISENIRNSGNTPGINLGKILRESGYSIQTSLKPRLVTETRGFKEELSLIMSDKQLVLTHASLLNAVKLEKYSFDPTITNTEIRSMVEGVVGYKVRNISRIPGKKTICYYWSPDSMIIDKALDKFYRIKGYYQKANRERDNSSIEVKVVHYRSETS